MAKTKDAKKADKKAVAVKTKNKKVDKPKAKKAGKAKAKKK